MSSTLRIQDVGCKQTRTDDYDAGRPYKKYAAVVRYFENTLASRESYVNNRAPEIAGLLLGPRQKQ